MFNSWTSLLLVSMGHFSRLNYMASKSSRYFWGVMPSILLKVRCRTVRSVKPQRCATASLLQSGWTASPPARASISTEDVRLRSAIIPSRPFLCFFIVFLRLCRRKLVPLQRFLEKALRERAAPRHRASSLHSVCTVLARCNQEHH